MPSNNIVDFAYQVKNYMRNAEVVEGKNLINVVVTTKLNRNGIDYTVNADKSITRNGTASGTSFLILTGDGAITQNLDTDYQTAIIKIGQRVVSLCDIQFRHTDGNYGSFQAGTVYTVSKDIGVFYISSTNGVQVDDTVYPMICSEDDWNKSHTYEPYYVPVKDSKLDIADQQVLGAWNLAKNTLTSKNISGIHVTVNNDKSVTIYTDAGGATSTENFPIFTGGVNQDELNKYGSNHYYLSGCPSGGSTSTYFMYVHPGQTGGSWNPRVVDTGDGTEFDYDGNSLVYFAISIQQGTIITTPLTFYPQIALEFNKPYSTHAMTNRELTERTTIDQTSCTGFPNDVTVNRNTVKKIGDLVVLDIDVSSATFTANDVICTIPSSYRPFDNIIIGGINRSSNSFVAVVLKTNGEVVIRSNLNGDFALHETYTVK